MTDNIRLVQNVTNFFRHATDQQLYLVVEQLADELARRGASAMLEARALQAALLPAARDAHRAIFSGDCSTPCCLANADDSTRHDTDRCPKFAPTES